ncbi:polysaccharide lyase family 1 protein [Chryseobacterium viscerum]|uniref:pectate lyase family protein n=1 Tax=Chryseobacterium TaxID=59732 RepID=UPI0022227B1A|nr:pectate lyase-like adhesive domain-containing protein [Chryseobacterium viscerum]MCW1962592.1 pectate lyase [Chryseobacterium viscerum]WPO89406.1 pectate lyase [Chryseobacterium sp. HR92]
MKTTFKAAFLMVALSSTFALTGCGQEDIKTDLAENPNELSLGNKLVANAVVPLANCVAPGWASQNGGTTGGGTAAETTVATYAQLKAAIENTAVKVIKVTGTITITTRLSLQDQTGKTLYGTSGAKLVSTDQTASGSGIINIKRCNNIVIRNLIFEGPGAYDTDGWDNAILDDCRNVWIDHCEFRDGVDGNFDIKNKSDFVTVSYTKFHYLKAPKPGGSGGTDDHRFSNLIGSGDGATADAGKLNVTFVRCWWAPGCRERMPRVRFGKIHIVNSYFNSSVSNKCIAAGVQANIRVDGNVFENVKEPINLMSGYTAVTVTSNNTFTNVTGNTAGSGTAFTPPYTIPMLSLSSVKSDVTANAGATLTGNICNSL